MAMLLIPFPGVFQPHSDSRMLADRLARESLTSTTSVLDIGTGSGMLAIRAARAGAGHVTAVDISRRAVLAARVNARLNGVSVRALHGSLFERLAAERFDLIVSNPPYVPSPDDRLPARGPSRAWEGGARGRALIDRICSEVPRHLKPGGVLLLVHSSFCSERETVAALTGGGLDVAIVVRRRGALGDLGRARAAMLRERGLLGDGDSEEIVIVRAEMPREAAVAPRAA